MKRFHFPYGNERVNRKIAIVDDVINTMLLLTFIFQKPVGLSRFIQHQFNVSESWSEFIIAICVIVLVCIKQFITYHIDKWMQE